MVRTERRHRRGRNVLDLLTHPPPKHLYEMGHKTWNVLATCAQRRQENRKHIQTIIKIATEFATFHHLRQIAVGSGHEPNVDFVGAGATQSLELLLLQHTQKLGLQRQRNIPDLVKK